MSNGRASRVNSMFFILLAITIIIQHYFVNSFFLFWLVKMIEGLIVFDLILFIADYCRIRLKMDNDGLVHHEGDHFKVTVKADKVLSCRIKYFWTVTYQPYGKIYKIKSTDNFLVRTDVAAGDYWLDINKVKLCSVFSNFCLSKKVKETAGVRIYPRMISIGLDSLSGIFEGEDDKTRGYDFTEITGYHSYQPGDDLKHVHYALSAKMDDYIVKEGSRFGVKEYHYSIGEQAGFKEAAESCGRIYYLFETFARPNNEKILVHYRKDYVIVNSYDLYAFFDKVYGDYL